MMSVVVTGQATTLLEREDSLAGLDALLTGVTESSQGRLVLLGGEAGVGKTALLRAFCEAHVGQARVLWGACEPLRTPRPLGPLMDFAKTVGGEFDDLVSSAARPHDVAMALVSELSRRAPSVLVLEDVHWADEATLDVLTLLGPRIGSVPAFALASYRDDELDRSEQLRFVLGELVRRSCRLKLAPLSVAAVAELAGSYGVDGERLYRRTGGNPFFVTEVLAVGGEQIPETVRDAVIARAGRLSPGAQRLLEAVAVVPGQVDLWLLESLAGELITRVEECMHSGMLTADGSHVAFRHELARLAIEHRIPPDRRLAFHRAALAALEARSGERSEFARLAHHAEACGDRAAVLRWAPRAAEQAARAGSHREAADHYACALRFSEGLALERRAELLQRRVDECWLTDQFDAAIAAQEELLAWRRELGDRCGEGDALRTLSRLMFFVGRVDDGETLALEAVELLEGMEPTHELAMAYGNVSQRRMVLEDLESVVEWGSRAVDLATRLDDTEALVYALTNIGGAELDRCIDDGQEKLERALALALAEGLEDYAGRAFCTIVRCAVMNRDFALADTYLAPGLEYCSERGLDTWRLYLLAGRARLRLNRGEWDRAADDAMLVQHDPRSAVPARGLALTILGLVRVRRGDPEAWAPLDEEHALALPTHELARIGPLAAARAEAAWLPGNAARVKLETEVALALARKCCSPWLVGELAYLRWRAGAKDRLPPGTMAKPYELSIVGDWARAAVLWKEIGCPYEAALCLADGDDEEALRQSYDQLRALGARPAAAIVARKLRELGVRGLPRGPRTRTRENPAGLTARELEVLGLLADGLANAQIAERLVLSGKTVDHHVSAILRKLDVRSRAEAAATAARLGLANAG